MVGQIMFWTLGLIVSALLAVLAYLFIRGASELDDRWDCSEVQDDSASSRYNLNEERLEHTVSISNQNRVR